MIKYIIYIVLAGLVLSSETFSKMVLGLKEIITSINKEFLSYFPLELKGLLLLIIVLIIYMFYKTFKS